LLYKAGKDERLIVDGEPSTRQNYKGEYLLDSPVRGTDYYYYIIAVGKVNKDNTGNTPTGNRLISNRYHTQSYHFARTFQLVTNEMQQELPGGIQLFQNYPNPFNPSTTITYILDQPSEMKIQVFNMLGQKVATLTEATKSAGRHSVRWNAEEFSSGVYIYRLEVEGKRSVTKKLMLLK
jgi:hypothetical protein